MTPINEALIQHLRAVPSSVPLVLSVALGQFKLTVWPVTTDHCEAGTTYSLAEVPASEHTEIISWL